MTDSDKLDQQPVDQLDNGNAGEQLDQAPVDQLDERDSDQLDPPGAHSVTQPAPYGYVKDWETRAQDAPADDVVDQGDAGDSDVVDDASTPLVDESAGATPVDQPVDPTPDSVEQPAVVEQPAGDQ